MSAHAYASLVVSVLYHSFLETFQSRVVNVTDVRSIFFQISFELRITYVEVDKSIRTANLHFKTKTAIIPFVLWNAANLFARTISPEIDNHCVTKYEASTVPCATGMSVEIFCFCYYDFSFK